MSKKSTRFQFRYQMTRANPLQAISVKQADAYQLAIHSTSILTPVKHLLEQGKKTW